MKQVDIPGYKKIEIEHVVFDYNGTLATDGKLQSGVKEAIQSLSHESIVHVITADTFGIVEKEMMGMDIQLIVIPKEKQAEAKRDYVRQLGAGRTMAVGNGANDGAMLREAALGIAVLGDEGLAAAALTSADIVVKDILDLFGYFKTPDRLVATLRR